MKVLHTFLPVIAIYLNQEILLKEIKGVQQETHCN